MTSCIQPFALPREAAPLPVACAILWLTALGACAKSTETPPAAPMGAEMLTLRGNLTYLARVALMPDSRAIVALQEAGAAVGAASIAETRIEPNGRQVPIFFELTVPRSKLADGKNYELQGVIWSEGRPRWVSDRALVTPASGVIDVGALIMTAYQGGGAFATTFRCGDREAVIDYTEKGLQLKAGGETFDMRPVVAASGAKYEAEGDSTTIFWSKGSNAFVTVRGTRYPDCRQAGADKEVFRARGNEPGWSLEMGEETMTLVTDYGKTKRTMPRPPAQATAEGQRYATTAEGKDIVVTVMDRPCADAMTGMPYPQAVVVQADGRELKGCGGDPASLLEGKEWIVEDIDGKGIIDNSRASLNFGDDGHLYGRGSCNTYNARYTLTGEGLSVQNPATTLMACAPSLMEQEARFFGGLQGVQRFEIDPTGALILHGPPGRTITARR